jgi:hypothetical protein
MEETCLGFRSRDRNRKEDWYLDSYKKVRYEQINRFQERKVN